MNSSKVFFLALAFAIALNVDAVPMAIQKQTVAASLPETINVENIVNHLRSLESIAYSPQYNGTRSIAAGYNASADYVISQLIRNTPCDVKKQPFTVAVWTEVEQAALSLSSPISIVFKYGQDFGPLRYGGSAKVEISGSIQYIQGGCESSDWSSFKSGSIALVQQSSACEDYIKAFNAEKAGARAFLLFNTVGSTGYTSARLRDREWKNGDPLVQIPSLALTYTTGQVLVGFASGASVNIKFNSITTYHDTFNVICDTNIGDESDILMIGAHLDSVPEGPGLVDNGSGSSALLEVVIQFFKSNIRPTKRVRFAWWGAEEIGLLGSRHYVRDLSTNDPVALGKISLYINFDMVASPNAVRYILDSKSAPPVAQPGSLLIQQTFEDYFGSNKLVYTFSGMSTGSDYYPFLAANIPAGGLFTGAGSIKTATQRTTFGGYANAAYDPCYHLPCDSLENIDQVYLEQNAKAAAYALEILSQTPKSK
eukprot:TRINITY_DN4081_c0_g1_i1.p1 TRINITY_DN4081_c0_g1~~TRINITY_DN4081_c0_g1_i1.p1  ORF type:complete len:482 (-),score=123.92 TRINITY_DN4081_c0_g1_i1:99-1544(-)